MTPARVPRGDGSSERSGDDLAAAALECGYEAATVAELCRFYYDEPRPAELRDEQAAEMAARLRLAHARRVSDARLRALARKGRRSEDPVLARRAADGWLTFRDPAATDDAPSA